MPTLCRLLRSGSRVSARASSTIFGILVACRGAIVVDGPGPLSSAMLQSAPFPLTHSFRDVPEVLSRPAPADRPWRHSMTRTFSLVPLALGAALLAAFVPARPAASGE